ncbi:MAG: cystathionine gamma-synthase [Acidobacteria bacterium]|nr:cystathionine gamma-synthase [Acidobacteriota bacterium]
MKVSLATQAVRHGIETDTQHGAVIPPLYLSSNYTFEDFNVKRPYDYTRSGNPTRDVLGETLAALEGGQRAVITATGMAAVTLCTHLLESEDLLVVSMDCYGGTHRLFTHLAKKGHFQVMFADLTDPLVLGSCRIKKPRMFWVETPSNPLLRITDITAVVQAARAVDALVVVDNTFLSPELQQPLRLGADIVVHSTTKYINGHSDVVGGAVVARSTELGEQLIWWANCLGITGSPFDSYLTLRGLRTLSARMRIHCENAIEVANCLRRHPRVRQVYFPGFHDHVGHQVAASQQTGFGGMVSFELEGGQADLAAFIRRLNCFSLAESLGGVESLVAHPATMTHAAMDAGSRALAGISDQLIRLSVGIEDPLDLTRDLNAALDAPHTVYLRGVQ